MDDHMLADKGSSTMHPAKRKYLLMQQRAQSVQQARQKKPKWNVPTSKKVRGVSQPSQNFRKARESSQEVNASISMEER